MAQPWPRLNQDERRAVASEYLSGVSVAELVRRWSVAEMTIYKTLRDAGVPRTMAFRRMPMRERQELVDEYAAGQSQTAIAAKHRIDRAAVGYWLRKAGVAARPLSEAFRKLPVNEHAFDTITEESAYWIGLLITDGCVCKQTLKTGTRWTISLVLKTSDGDHVRRFRDFLGSQHWIGRGSVKPSEKGGTGSIRFGVTSARLAKRLGEFGVVPRKSLVAEVSSNLEDNRDFWRGAIDGDGSVRWATQGSLSYPNLILYGSLRLVSQFREFVTRRIGPIRPTIRPSSTIFKLSLHGKVAQQIATILYAGCSIALPRKLTTAKEFMNA